MSTDLFALAAPARDATVARLPAGSADETFLEVHLQAITVAWVHQITGGAALTGAEVIALCHAIGGLIHMLAMNLHSNRDDGRGLGADEMLKLLLPLIAANAARRTRLAQSGLSDDLTVALKADAADVLQSVPFDFADLMKPPA